MSVTRRAAWEDVTLGTASARRASLGSTARGEGQEHVLDTASFSLQSLPKFTKS